MAPILSNATCTSQVLFSVQVFSNFGEIGTTGFSPCTQNANASGSGTACAYATGSASQIVGVRVVYNRPFIVPWVGACLTGGTCWFGVGTQTGTRDRDEYRPADFDCDLRERAVPVMTGILTLMAKTQSLLHLRRLAGDRSGTAFVEFAVLLPVLLTLFIGSYETSNLLLAYMKLEAAAETAADLVGQVPVNTILVTSGSSNGWDFGNITSAVQQVMTPFPTTPLKVSYASITYSTGSAVLDWHYETTGATAIAVGAAARRRDRDHDGNGLRADRTTASSPSRSSMPTPRRSASISTPTTC